MAGVAFDMPAGATGGSSQKMRRKPTRTTSTAHHETGTLNDEGQQQRKRRISVADASGYGSDDDNGEWMGNLGATFIKRMYILVEIILDFFILADLSANLQFRWHIVNDRVYIVFMVLFAVLGLLANLILSFALAFANLHLTPYKGKIRFYRPIWILFLGIPQLIFVMQNSMYVMFTYAMPLFAAKVVVGGHLLLENSIPIITNIKPSNFFEPNAQEGLTKVKDK